MEKLLQDFKDKINLKQGFNAYWNKGFDDAVKFMKDNGALSQHDVIKNEVAVCDKCLGRGSIVIYDNCLDCEKCKGTGTQTVL